MNNESIKEILDDLREKDCYVNNETILTFDEAGLLLDYITNLQQENISLAKGNEKEKQFIKGCGFENIQQLALDYIGIRQEKEDYKSRCEKVKEYIEKHVICMKNSNILTELNINDLLNILQGGKDDNKKEGK